MPKRYDFDTAGGNIQGSNLKYFCIIDKGILCSKSKFSPRKVPKRPSSYRVKELFHLAYQCF